MLISILVIIACTVAIWWCSERLSEGTDAIGRRYGIAPGVRGATLDAVASSFPEFCTVIFALIAGAFDAGVGTVAGSALFNILVIPALASLMVGGLSVRREVVARDGLVYIGVVAAFIAVFYFGAAGEKGPDFKVVPAWGGFLALITYAAYVVFLAMQPREAQPPTPTEGKAEEAGPEDALLAMRQATWRVAVGMAGVGVACHFLVEHGLSLVKALGFSPAVAGVTILAAATSLPDTLLSVFAAKRGDGDGAIANAFASNTFDILICLGLPILISGGLQMNWVEGWPILACLLLSTIAAVWLMITEWTITVLESLVKLALYILFCVAVFMRWI